MTTTTKPTRAERLREMRTGLSQRRATLAAELKAIDDDERYAPEYKTQLKAEARAAWGRITHRDADDAWKVTRKLRADLEKDLHAAAGVQRTDWDYGKLNFLTAEFTSAINAAPVSGLGSNDRLVTIGRLVERAQLANDAHQLRALRTAAAPVLRDIRRTAGNDGSTRAAAGDLLRVLEHDPAAEQIERLQGEQRILDLYTRDLRGEIEACEADATGQQRHGLFAPISEWQGSIFGETLENTGRVAVRGDGETVVDGGTNQAAD
jgi:hypothetical protein